MRTMAVTTIAAAGMLLVPAGALAAHASGGEGQAYGRHHAAMAQDGHLGADMNPGMHRGFSDWMMREQALSASKPARNARSPSLVREERASPCSDTVAGDGDRPRHPPARAARPEHR